MTTVQIIKIQREDENSKWEKALRIHIDHFDAIEVVIDENGFIVDSYYDDKNVKTFKEHSIPFFP